MRLNIDTGWLTTWSPEPGAARTVLSCSTDDGGIAHDALDCFLTEIGASDAKLLELSPTEVTTRDPRRTLRQDIVDVYDGLTDDELLQRLSERLG